MTKSRQTNHVLPEAGGDSRPSILAADLFEKQFGSLMPPADAEAAEDLLIGLNPEQREAVLHTEGPLLVLAGAGSGKTRVITHRIARLVVAHGVRPWHILAITFTNKAAREMRERIENLIGDRAAGMWVGTFHSMMARVLRLHPREAGIRPDFTILDADDAQSTVRNILKEWNRLDAVESPRQVTDFISRAKNRLLDADTVAKQAEKSRLPQADLYSKVYLEYERLLRQNNAVDFDDLLMLPVQMFRKYPSVLAAFRRRFRYIHVDEYQDTNEAQYMLISLLAGEHRNLCVVGDDDQSIYGFRGANVNNILNFEKQFPDAKVIRLEQNYRSTGNILAAANAVIANNKSRKPKKLWTEHPDGDRITLFCGDDHQAEARYITGEIRRLILTDHTKQFSDFAILYRINALSRSLETALLATNIPFSIYGGLRFYDRREIRDVVAWLRLIHNDNDEMSFVRAVGMPRRGIGDQTLQRVQELSAANGISALEVCRRADTWPELRNMAGRLQGFATIIDGLREELREASSLADFVSTVQERSGLNDAILKEMERDPLRGQERLENMRELLSDVSEFLDSPLPPDLVEQVLAEYARQYAEAVAAEDGAVSEENAVFAASHVANMPDRGAIIEMIAGQTVAETFADNSRLLGAWLERAALYSDSDKDSEESPKVKLMTIHSAKGLEFDTVFLVGAEEGIFPSWKSIGSPEDLEEERRLAYVAMTRAERRLYITHTDSRMLYGKTEGRVPSRFLNELPTECVDEIMPSVSYLSGRGGRRDASTPAGSFRRRREAVSIQPATGAGTPHVREAMGLGVTRSAGVFARPTDSDEFLKADQVKKGDRVRHPARGAGTILDCQPVADDMVLKIKFDSQKEDEPPARLLLRSARLTRN